MSCSGRCRDACCFDFENYYPISDPYCKNDTTNLISDKILTALIFGSAGKSYTELTVHILVNP